MSNICAHFWLKITHHAKHIWKHHYVTFLKGMIFSSLSGYDIRETEKLWQRMKELLTSFLTPSIDSTENLSANENPDTIKVMFKVSDPYIIRDSLIINIIVNNINEPPMFTSQIFDVSIFEDEVLNFGTDIAFDIDADELEFSATSEIDLTIEIENEYITILPILNFNGTISILLNVSDGPGRGMLPCLIRETYQVP